MSINCDVSSNMCLQAIDSLISACFPLTRTVLLLLKMVAEYCQCVEDIPTVSMDILTRLIEILQVCNT